MGTTAHKGNSSMGNLRPNEESSHANRVSPEVARAMHIIAASHQLPTENSKSFNFLSQALRYEEELVSYGPIEETGYEALKKSATDVADLVLRDNAPVSLSHRAFLLTNSGTENDRKAMQDNRGLQSSDYATDFSTYVVTRNLKPSDVISALGEYLGRKPTRSEIRHHWAMIGLAGWTSYIWCLLEEARSRQGVVDKERCRDIAANYLAEALDMYAQD